MKKTAVVLGSSLALFASVASADNSSHAEAAVYVDVDSNIAVITNGAVDMGSRMIGTFGETVTFHVQSNHEQIWMSAAATHLYKGMDASSEVSPLMVVAEDGVTITPSSGNRLMSEGGDNTLALNDSEYMHESGMAGYMSETGGFESSQNHIWNQDVDVDFTWTIPTTQTEGEYGGYVSLWVYIDGAAATSSSVEL